MLLICTHYVWTLVSELICLVPLCCLAFLRSLTVEVMQQVILPIAKQTMDWAFSWDGHAAGGNSNAHKKDGPSLPIVSSTRPTGSSFPGAGTGAAAGGARVSSTSGSTGASSSSMSSRLWNSQFRFELTVGDSDQDQKEHQVTSSQLIVQPQVLSNLSLQSAIRGLTGRFMLSGIHSAHVV
jgi:hypothetical protein